MNAVLNERETEDIIYPQPMLADQIEYLYEMINAADQAPGTEAEDRFDVLAKAFGAIRKMTDP